MLALISSVMGDYEKGAPAVPYGALLCGAARVSGLSAAVQSEAHPR